MKNNVISPNQFNRSGANKAPSAEELLRRIESLASISSKAVKEINDKLAGMTKAMHESHVRAEAFYNASMKKGLLTGEELSESMAEVNTKIMDAAEAMYDAANKLQVVDKVIEPNDMVVISFDVRDHNTQQVFEQQDRTHLKANEQAYQFTQLKEVAKSLVGHKTGEEVDLHFTVPSDEAKNRFAGQEVDLRYKILRVKVVAQDEPKQDEPPK